MPIPSEFLCHPTYCQLIRSAFWMLFAHAQCRAYCIILHVLIYFRHKNAIEIKIESKIITRWLCWIQDFPYLFLCDALEWKHVEIKSHALRPTKQNHRWTCNRIKIRITLHCYCFDRPTDSLEGLRIHNALYQLHPHIPCICNWPALSESGCCTINIAQSDFCFFYHIRTTIIAKIRKKKQQTEKKPSALLYTVCSYFGGSSM